MKEAQTEVISVFMVQEADDSGRSNSIKLNEFTRVMCVFVQCKDALVELLQSGCDVTHIEHQRQDNRYDFRESVVAILLTTEAYRFAWISPDVYREMAFWV